MTWGRSLISAACGRGQQGDGLRAYAGLNAADPGSSSDNIEAAAALADFLQLRLLDTPIRRRKGFRKSPGSRLSVDELTPRDPKACEELAALVQWRLTMQLISRY